MGPREQLEAAAETVATALGCDVEAEAGHRIIIQARNAHGELEIVALWNSEGGIWSRLVKLAQDNADLRHDIERHVQIASDLANEPTAAEERALIAAWIRDDCPGCPYVAEHAIAEAIERQEHRKHGTASKGETRMERNRVACRAEDMPPELSAKLGAVIDETQARLAGAHLTPSRTGITDPLERMTQVMCDAMRRSQGASVCELCDLPCDQPEAAETARVALALVAEERASIVAWLRKVGDQHDGYKWSGAWVAAADAIERNEHAL